MTARAVHLVDHVWPEALMRRSFDVDVQACPRCGGRLRLLALLEAGVATARILRHLGLALPGDGEVALTPSA